MERHTPRFYEVQRRAIAQTRKAIQAGKLTRQGCNVCGSLHNVHAHHDDYRKPMAVTWLCSRHHIERHQWLDTLGWLGKGVPKHRNKVIPPQHHKTLRKTK